MPDETGAIVPVTDANKGDVVKVNDAGNRASRSFTGTSGISLVIYFLDKYGGVNVDMNDVLLALPFLTSGLAYAWRFCEIRGWFRFLQVPPAANIAAPVTEGGQVLGQLKT